MYICLFLEDDDENPEFAALVENFRSESTKLLDMLDVSSPVVARLKVKGEVSCCTKIVSVGLTAQPKFVPSLPENAQFYPSHDAS